MDALVVDDVGTLTADGAELRAVRVFTDGATPRDVLTAAALRAVGRTREERGGRDGVAQREPRAASRIVRTRATPTRGFDATRDGESRAKARGRRVGVSRV